MVWQKKGSGKYLKWETGKIITGAFKRADNERPSAFNPEKMSIDYHIDIEGTEHILSSTSDYLKANLFPLSEGTLIRLTMNQVGAKKMFSLEVDE